MKKKKLAIIILVIVVVIFGFVSLGREGFFDGIFPFFKTELNEERVVEILNDNYDCIEITDVKLTTFSGFVDGTWEARCKLGQIPFRKWVTPYGNVYDESIFIDRISDSLVR
ncbi:MAG: hypothetical protein V1838_01855 [Patescibacteria group bacterium]